MNRNFFLLILVASLCLCVLPALAVIQEVTLKGTVSALDREMNTLTIENPARYGCDYPAGGSPVCTFTPIDSVPVTGAVPDSGAFTVFKVGDTVVATSLGGVGGNWITLAKLYGPGPNEEYVTDLVGDPGTIQTPFVGDYALDIATTPDCTTCSGTTCTAVSAEVKVKSSGTVVFSKVLPPRYSLEYNGRNDGSAIAVTFVHGEAPSTTCASGVYGMTGPQPLSVFLVNVVPPIGFTPQDTIPAETSAPAAPAPTTKAPLTAAAAFGALCFVTLVLAGRKP
ncbi:MAG TPA: hypothetical protein HA272_02415 [Methanoregula sp.]|nr:hypothetical protein [Methanoregula sp.]